MSNLFSRMNVISQSQHDSETESPPIARRPTSLFARVPDTATIPDDDPESSSPPKVPTNTEGWVSRCSLAEVQDFQDKLEHMKQLQRNTNEEKARALNISKLKVGVEVWTKDKSIAKLSKSRGPKGKRRSREQTFGIIKKRSNRNSTFWYIEFQNGKRMYCSQDILTFHSVVPQVVHLGRTKDNKLCLTKPNASYVSIEEQDKVKNQILLAKIYQLPGHDSVTYETLERVHKHTHPWISAWKLRAYISKIHKKMLGQAATDSWIMNIEEENKKKQPSTSTSKKTIMFTTTTNNIANNMKCTVVADNLAEDSIDFNHPDVNDKLASKFL